MILEYSKKVRNQRGFSFILGIILFGYLIISGILKGEEIFIISIFILLLLYYGYRMYETFKGSLNTIELKKDRMVINGVEYLRNDTKFSLNYEVKKNLGFILFTEDRSLKIKNESGSKVINLILFDDDSFQLIQQWLKH